MPFVASGPIIRAMTSERRPPPPFDFDAAVTAPFRMQPGLRKLAPGALQFTPLDPRSPAFAAKLVGTGFEVLVPIFVENGDKIEIDTRTHEYRKRV